MSIRSWRTVSAMMVQPSIIHMAILRASSLALCMPTPFVSSSTDRDPHMYGWLAHSICAGLPMHVLAHILYISRHRPATARILYGRPTCVAQIMLGRRFLCPAGGCSGSRHTHRHHKLKREGGSCMHACSAIACGRSRVGVELEKQTRRKVQGRQQTRRPCSYSYPTLLSIRLIHDDGDDHYCSLSLARVGLGCAGRMHDRQPRPPTHPHLQLQPQA